MDQPFTANLGQSGSIEGANQLDGPREPWHASDDVGVEYQGAGRDLLPSSLSRRTRKRYKKNRRGINRKR